MNKEQVPSAAAAGTFAIGGDLNVNRLGYGAMRITGPGVWGPPPDKAAAIATLRRAVELDVNVIDTADSYGPEISEELIAEALYPYPAGLVIATKGGWERPAPSSGPTTPAPNTLRKHWKEVSDVCGWSASMYTSSMLLTTRSHSRRQWTG